MRKKQLLVWIMLWQLVAGFGQPLRLQAGLDTAHIRIGEHLNLHIEWKQPPGYVLTLLPDSLASFELLERQRDTLEKDSTWSVLERLQLTTFDTGYLVLPSLPVYAVGPDGPADTLRTQPFHVLVESVPVDTTQPIKPIEAPLPVGLTRWEILSRIVIALMVVLLGIALWWLWKHRKKENEKPGPIPEDVPPHIWALTQLDKLEKEKLWQHDQVKTYYIRLTEILRTYLVYRFAKPILEYTTSETLRTLRADLSAEQLEFLRSVLETADLAKFAKARPMPDEHTRAMEYARKLVTGTAVVEKPLKENE